MDLTKEDINKLAGLEWEFSMGWGIAEYVADMGYRGRVTLRIADIEDGNVRRYYELLYDGELVYSGDELKPLYDSVNILARVRERQAREAKLSEFKKAISSIETQS